MQKLQDQGISLRSWRGGDHKTTCPKCSHNRKNKKDPCLSVTIKDDGGAVWKCHNCEWTGGFSNSDRQTPSPIRKKPPVRLVEPATVEINAEVRAWLSRRGISQETAEHFGIYRTEKSFGNKPEGCIVFPYRVDGELVNNKYRTKDKRFRQEGGATRSLFNIDAVRKYWQETGDRTVIFVEGEMDVLSMWEAGFDNVVTLPDGAPQEAKYDEDDKRFKALQSHEWLNDADRVILAVDGDNAGQALQLELIHRFGKDRCWTIEFPSIADIPCKDANDILMMSDGVELLREVIANAKPFPVEGLFTAKDYHREVFNIYEGKVQKPLSTGFTELDKIYQVMPSTFCVVTGVPNHGKSNFIDQLAVNMARNHDWKFAVFSPEHSTPNHLRRLAEKVVRKPFDVGPSERMSADDLVSAMQFLDDRFFFIESEDNVPSIDWLLAKARAACLNYGVKGIIIDPYNEIDASRSDNKREDEHIRDLISSCKQFCRRHEVAMWMVAHPAKMQRNQEGVIPVPTLYDVSGSAHWNNMADVGLVVYRDFETDHTQVITRKIREQGLYGEIGQCFFRYNTSARVYEQQAQYPVASHWTDHN